VEQHLRALLRGERVEREVLRRTALQLGGAKERTSKSPIPFVHVICWTRSLPIPTTTRPLESNRVRAFDGGCDDYVDRPFH
jgi:hypothetical protein